MFKILNLYFLVNDLVIFIVASDLLCINYKNYVLLVLNCHFSKVKCFVSLEQDFHEGNGNNAVTLVHVFRIFRFHGLY